MLTALPNRAADEPDHAVTWASRRLHRIKALQCMQQLQQSLIQEGLTMTSAAVESVQTPGFQQHVPSWFAPVHLGQTSGL